MDKQYKPDRLNPFFKIALRTSFATRLVVFCLFFSYFVLIFDYFLHQNLAKTCKYFWELNSRLAFWCKLKKTNFLINFAPNLLLFCIFSAFFYIKMQRMTISSSIWGAQHQNAGSNIQQMSL